MGACFPMRVAVQFPGGPQSQQVDGAGACRGVTEADARGGNSPPLVPSHSPFISDVAQTRSPALSQYHSKWCAS